MIPVYFYMTDGTDLMIEVPGLSILEEKLKKKSDFLILESNSKIFMINKANITHIYFDLEQAKK